MSEMVNPAPAPVALSHGCREIEGKPQPGLEDGADAAIFKVMVAQRREINRRNLPDLEP